ncbi:MAG: DNA mismatch repair protein MutS [Bacteroidota bacterium]
MARGKEGKETPLMKQYNAIKAKYPGALLLFRVGDFYETFGEDAISASKVLDIVLTKRANGSASEVELAGFPHHALDTYLPKLVRAGNRVAICDQLEDPKTVKGIVKRGVTELVTPGLSFNDNVLDKKVNNYLASVYFHKSNLGVAFLDLSTGEFMAAEGTVDYVQKLIQSFNPAEIIYSKAHRKQFAETFGEEHITFTIDDWVFGEDYGYETLTSHFGTNNLKGYGLETIKLAIVAAGAVLYYLNETEHKETGHILSISRIAEDKYVWLDKFTIRNLELVYAQADGGIPLIDILDHTVTAMGGRMMKKWMVLPLKDKLVIDERLEMVNTFLKKRSLRETILSHLKQISDLERLISKVAVGRINPRELLMLKKAMAETQPIKKILQETKSKEFKLYGDKLNNCKLLQERLAEQLSDDAPMLIHQGGIIKDGIDKELDELRAIAYSGKDYLMQIRKREVERTGISSLKIAYNKVFGYYLEVSNAHKDKVPPEWIRKQTLVNAERYITEELKEYEEKILNAEGKLLIIEQDLFAQLVAYAGEYVSHIQNNARILATIDALISFAFVAAQNKYCQPQINDGHALEIKAGRHPVIEKSLPLGEAYVPNNIFIDNESQQIIIITGPNMSGKSALLRQTALIVLMAQMGSFVPAKSAKIGLVDKVFTRVGASDNLSQGESTFMVEMTETASILNNLSSNSLILMDEIGRGTSTYDGVAIAWSIVEHLHNNLSARPKTLFATHYHELNQLAEDLPRVKNFNVSVKEVGDKVIFMRTLKEGGSEHSFGIHVAQMAGMPNPVVLRANEIMHFLEEDHNHHKEKKKKMEKMPKANYQMSMFEPDPRFKEMLEFMESFDINTISPVEALLKLNELKSKLKKDK